VVRYVEVEKPVETVRVVEIEKIIERPSESVKIVEIIKEVQVPVIKEVIKEVLKYIDVPVETQVIKTITQRVEIPIETVKIQTIEKIVEKLVEVEKFIEVEKSKDEDCDCISEVKFVQLWNKLMMINFSDNTLKEECLSDSRFIDLVITNLKNNHSAIQEKLAI